ncbi:Pre-mRNA-processing protein 40A [Zea mays]|uniref:Pre-mRNA-processing protein 40A n=1 Tax=Zea mays TaxID=4577 RepID=A0A1D6NNV8_MAIZE|nr:Pre-mRNA-processing protein 40A [Zea mays]
MWGLKVISKWELNYLLILVTYLQFLVDTTIFL